MGNERHATILLVALGDSYRLVGREGDAYRVLHDALGRHRARPEGTKAGEIEACLLASAGPAPSTGPAPISRPA